MHVHSYIVRVHGTTRFRGMERDNWTPSENTGFFKINDTTFNIWKQEIVYMKLN